MDWSPHHDGRHRDPFWDNYERKEVDDLLASSDERARIARFSQRLVEVNHRISHEEIVNAPSVQKLIDKGMSEMTDHWLMAFHSEITMRKAFEKEWDFTWPKTWRDHAKIRLVNWTAEKPRDRWRRFLWWLCFKVLRWDHGEWDRRTVRIEVDQVLSTFVIPEGEYKTCIMIREDGQTVTR